MPDPVNKRPNPVAEPRPAGEIGVGNEPLPVVDFVHHRFANWLVVRPLGAGSFGAVYEAHNEIVAGRVAAVKVLHPQLAMTEPDIDGRADIYSLGVILHRCLTGELPFRAKTPAEWFRAHMDQPVPALSRIAARAPLLATVVQRMLAKDRDARQRTMTEVTGNLEWARIEGGPRKLSPTAVTTRVEKVRAEPRDEESMAEVPLPVISNVPRTAPITPPPSPGLVDPRNVATPGVGVNGLQRVPHRASARSSGGRRVERGRGHLRERGVNGGEAPPPGAVAVMPARSPADQLPAREDGGGAATQSAAPNPFGLKNPIADGPAARRTAGPI